MPTGHTPPPTHLPSKSRNSRPTRITWRRGTPRPRPPTRTGAHTTWAVVRPNPGMALARLLVKGLDVGAHLDLERPPEGAGRIAFPHYGFPGLQVVKLYGRTPPGRSFALGALGANAEVGAIES